MNKELNEVLRLHKLWLENEPEGEHANLSYADLSYADLRNADLRNANLRYADLSYADLEHAYLRYAYLSNANLSNANLRYADLEHAYLSNADLEGANLSNANLEGADLSNATLFTYGCHSDKMIQLSGMLYHIYIMDNHIKIGCKAYTREEWQNFTDEEILKMDGKDGLRFWKQYKDAILSINTK